MALSRAAFALAALAATGSVAAAGGPGADVDLAFAARIVRLPSSPFPLATPAAPAAESATLRVSIAGEGTAVVLIPGMFGSSFGYRKLAPKLAEAGYRAIAVEPLGVGGSARPGEADYSLTAQAERLAAALPALGTERAVFVVHSAAASIVFRLAFRHPERVIAIVSLEGGTPEQVVTPGFRRAMTFAPLIRLLGGKRLIRGKVRSTLLGGAADKSWVTDEVVDGYMAAAAQDLGATLRVYKRMASAREPELLAPHLPRVRAPVRLLMGAAPHQGGPDEAEIQRLRQALPHLVVERLPGVGHYAYEEDPAAVVRAVMNASGGAPGATAIPP